MPPRHLVPKTFEELSLATFREQYRFEKHHIALLVSIFTLGPFIKLDNGTKVKSKLALCILLRKLVFPVRTADLEELFGIDRSLCSRICNSILSHVFENHSYLLKIRKCLVNNNKEFWSSAIRNKNNCPLDSCLGFIDGTNKAICRPIKYQKKVYSGHKRQHTLKYQGVVAPCGIFLDLHGPHLGIRHDARILVDSQFIDRISHCAPRGYYIYGDPAYKIRRYIVGPFEAAADNSPEALFNSKMSEVRIVVEWAFGGVVNLFRSMQYSKHWRLYSQQVGNYYKMACLFYNIYGILYSNQISQYFDCRLTLDEFLHCCPDCFSPELINTDRPTLISSGENIDPSSTVLNSSDINEQYNNE